jgi:hypothetical protein
MLIQESWYSRYDNANKRYAQSNDRKPESILNLNHPHSLWIIDCILHLDEEGGRWTAATQTWQNGNERQVGQ